MGGSKYNSLARFSGAMDERYFQQLGDHVVPPPSTIPAEDVVAASFATVANQLYLATIKNLTAAFTPKSIVCKWSDVVNPVALGVYEVMGKWPKPELHLIDKLTGVAPALGLSGRHVLSISNYVTLDPRKKYVAGALFSAIGNALGVQLAGTIIGPFGGYVPTVTAFPETLTLGESPTRPTSDIPQIILSEFDVGVPTSALWSGVGLY